MLQIERDSYFTSKYMIEGITKKESCYANELDYKSGLYDIRLDTDTFALLSA